MLTLNVLAKFTVLALFNSVSQFHSFNKCYLQMAILLNKSSFKSETTWNLTEEIEEYK